MSNQIIEKLTEGDKKILLTLFDNKDRIGGWGAWVSACLEFLKSEGLVTGISKIKLTPLGESVCRNLVNE